jgi:adenine-specific DNA-methyltransferase
MPRGKLELTWVGKDERPRLEPRVLVEDPAKSYGDPNSENMLIFGDNLLALKALEQDFAGRIKCIFIDPPYNTGSAFTHYDDGLEHSIWLTLMRDRLAVLKSLLADDGSLWITIDDNEGHYLKVLCDETFGRQNFVVCAVWQHSIQGKNDAKGFSLHHNYVVAYRKTEASIVRRLPREEKHNTYYSNPDNDPKGPWRSGDVRSPNPRENLTYDVVTPSGNVIKPPPKGWRWSKELFWEKASSGEITFVDNDTRVLRKIYLCDQENRVPESIWFGEDVGTTREANSELKALFPDLADRFTTPKPERLLKRVAQLASKEGDWVLDSFGGSGTTAAVSHKMGRKWIVVELGEHCHTHIIPRMQKVIDGTDQGGISKAVGWKGGGGFKYYRLAETLLVQDKDLSAKGHPVYVINPKYDDKMLIRAICKIEGFRYRNEGRLHGVSSENRFLHVTTQLVTQAYLDSLVQDIALEQSLLIYCTRRSRGLSVPDNVEVKKIPRDLLHKCDFSEG